MNFGGVFCYIWLDLEIFIGEGRDEVKWACFKNYSITFCKILWIASSCQCLYMPKGIFDWIKIKWIFGSFVVILGLRNFHMGGEVRWTFPKKLLYNFCEILWIASWCQCLCALKSNFGLNQNEMDFCGRLAVPLLHPRGVHSRRVRTCLFLELLNPFKLTEYLSC